MGGACKAPPRDLAGYPYLGLTLTGRENRGCWVHSAFSDQTEYHR